MYNVRGDFYPYFDRKHVSKIGQGQFLLQQHCYAFILENEIQALTILQANAWFQKLAPSSRLKSTPPTGAPKAADTPAAAPPATKSRFSVSDRKNSNI